MRGSSFTYLVKQGIINTWLNRMMTLASIGILTACLIIVGGSGLLAVNIRDIFVDIESQNEVVAFIADDATEAQVDSVEVLIKSLKYVNDYRYISKEAALREQKEYMGDQGYLLDGLEGEENPLPASFRITLDGLEYIDLLVAELEGKAGVESISAPVDLAETLGGIEKTMIVMGSIIIGILIVASAVVISNTIRLTLYARRREISIMKYVGATNGFIRLPFVVEGITIGIVSALFGFGILSGIYASLGSMLGETGISWLTNVSSIIIPYSKLWYWVLGGFMGFGILIGAVSSGTSIRRYLEV